MTTTCSDETEQTMTHNSYYRVRRHLRRRREGMTLVEIMVVVIIMAIIAAAVGFAVVPRVLQARIETTRTDARTIAQIATNYVVERPNADCPSVQDLVEGGYMDRNQRTVDAWDHEFVVECDGNGVVVISGGPDEGEQDDIRSDQTGNQEDN
jgi:general secretion pathway protein G